MANVDMCEHDWPGSGCKKCFPPKAFDNFRWPLGTRVTKTKGSQWTGKVVGFYSTSLTAEGYAVESETERGSVQIYPVAALKELDGE